MKAIKVLKVILLTLSLGAIVYGGISLVALRLSAPGFGMKSMLFGILAGVGAIMATLAILFNATRNRGVHLAGLVVHLVGFACAVVAGVFALLVISQYTKPEYDAQGYKYFIPALVMIIGGGVGILEWPFELALYCHQNDLSFVSISQDNRKNVDEADLEAIRKVEKWKKLYVSGAITEAEFLKRRNDILNL